MSTIEPRLSASKHHPAKEKGQVLVIVVFAIVGLIAFIGLVVDLGLVYIGLGFCAFFLFVVAGMGHDASLFVFAAAVTLLAFGAAALVHSALSGIYEAALYRYATKGDAVLGFDGDALQRAFRPK